MVNAILCDLFIDCACILLYLETWRRRDMSLASPWLVPCVLTDTPYSVASLHLPYCNHV